MFLSPLCVSCLYFRQPAPHHLLPAAQAHSHSLRVHPPGLQVVQLGDPGLHRRQTLVGVPGPHSDAAAAGR